MEIFKVGLINSLGKTEGCENAPNEILKELKNLGSNENGEILEYSSLNINEIHFDKNNLEEANFLIEKKSEESFYKNRKVFFLGGDHSISYPILRAFNKVEENPFLIIFDAHADCIENGREPTHEEWLRGLVESGFSPRKIILISARNLWEDEIKFLRENEILWIKMDILREDLEGVCDLVMERARNSSGFYISLDIDSIDPGFAPAVSYPEPGGLFSNDIIYFIKRLVLLENFRGGDIVEINPNKDFNKISVKLGARILREMI